MTDPDAAWGVKSGPATLGYYDNYLVDTTSRVILSVDATPARFRQEVLAAQRMIEHVSRLGIRPQSLAADKAYGSGEFLAWLLERDIQPHIPVIDRQHQTRGRFTRDAFRYEPKENAYYCLEGKPLHYRGQRRSSQGNLYRSTEAQCRGCPQKKLCTAGSYRRLFVHWQEPLRDLKQIAVINRSTHTITRWPLTLEHNFPMALDEADHRLFVGTHEPARLAVFDTTSGHMIIALPSVQDADDLYYDAGRKRIYMAGGEGFIYTFQQGDPDHYQLLVKTPTALGARTAGYFGKGKKSFDRFWLAVAARADHGAEIWIYTVQD